MSPSYFSLPPLTASLVLPGEPVGREAVAEREHLPEAVPDAERGDCGAAAGGTQ